jgi:signal transduction histidine kinase/CheY-like chemotaxis protein
MPSESLFRMRSRFNGGAGRRSLLLLALVATALVATSAVGLIGFTWRTLDQREAAREVFLVRRAVDRALKRTMMETRSDAAWDGAYRQLTGPFERRFFDLDVVSYYRPDFGHDLTMVIDRSGRLRYAALDGKTTDPSRLEDLYRRLSPLVRQVQADELQRRLRARGQPVTMDTDTQGSASAAIRFGKDVFFLGLTTVAPSRGFAFGEAPAPVIVSGPRVDARFLSAVGEDLGIAIPTLSGAAPPGWSSIPVLGTPGRPDVVLTWKPRRPGVDAFSRASGWIVAALALLVLTGAALAARIRQLLVRMEANDRALVDAMVELTRARDQAEAANHAKSQFLANVSHEIRTPLNGVLGMAQALERDALTPRQLERVQAIRASGKALLAVLNDVIDLSRIEAGKLELSSEAFDVGELVQSVCDTYRDVGVAKDVELRMQLAPEAAGGRRGDPMRIRQVLLNLVSNAIKFTDHGRVEVRVDAVADGLAFQVCDQGVGIPAERLGELFQKFSQVDGSATRRFAGAGLGLAICRELTGLMGGRIEVKSAPGVGSTFTVTLPLERADQAPRPGSAKASARSAPLSGRRIRLLAAEDNETNREVLRVLLEPLGAELVIVGDGAQAVEAFEKGEFDAVLMDVQMPVMGGVEAARRIRDFERLQGRSRTPILALSANVMTHQIDEYLAAGMDGHVGKPIEVERLYAALAAVLEGPAPSETTAAA